MTFPLGLSSVSRSAKPLSAVCCFLVLTLSAQAKDCPSLLKAARKGDVEQVRLCLSTNVAIDEADKGDNSALHWAARRGHLDVVRELLSAGAALGIKNRDGATPRELAVEGANEGIVDLIDSVLVSRAWQTAKDQDSEEGYAAFLEVHSMSAFASEAQRRREALAFATVEIEDTAAAYARFLQRFPSCDFASIAEDRLEERRYQEAEEADSVEAYESFLEQYPEPQYADSAHVQQAKSRLQVLYEELAEEKRARTEEKRYSEALETDLHGTYERFLADYPNSRYREQVQGNLKKFAHVVIEEDVFLSQEELKRRYNWNGLGPVVVVDPNGSFSVEGTRATGKVYIGNLQIDGSFLPDQKGGVTLFTGAVITYKP